MTAPFTSLALAAHASALMPDLKVVGLCPPTDQSESLQRQGIVDDQGRRWVVCAPLNDETAMAVEAQSFVLQILHRAFELGHIPFDVPVIEAQGRGSKTAGVFVHAQLPGEQMEWEDLASRPNLVTSVANAVAHLHALSPQVIERSGLPSYQPQALRERWQALLDEGVRAWTIPANLFERWEAALDNVALFKLLPSVVHGDMGPEVFTVSGSSVATISSFGRAHLGDPAEDLHWIASHPDSELVRRFFDIYTAKLGSRVDLHLHTRCQLYSELALVKWLLHGYRTQDSEVIADAQQMLRELSEELGDAQLVPLPPRASQSAETVSGDGHDLGEGKDLGEGPAGDATTLAADAGMPLGEDVPATSAGASEYSDPQFDLYDPEAPTVDLSAVIQEVLDHQH